MSASREQYHNTGKRFDKLSNYGQGQGHGSNGSGANSVYGRPHNRQVQNQQNRDSNGRALQQIICYTCGGRAIVGQSAHPMSLRSVGQLEKEPVHYLVLSSVVLVKFS